MGGKSLLDVYAAFATSTTSFRLPLLVNGTQQFFSLAMLMQLDMPLLYRQSVAGLAAFASQACHDADSPAGQLFSKGACQSLAIAVCALETPHHSTNLYTQYSMKDSSMRQGQVTGHDIMHRLEQKVRLSAQMCDLAGYALAEAAYQDFQQLCGWLLELLKESRDHLVLFGAHQHQVCLIRLHLHWS